MKTGQNWRNNDENFAYAESRETKAKMPKVEIPKAKMTKVQKQKPR